MGTERIIGERIIQMDWICKYCHHRNPGLAGEREGLGCAHCGHAKEAEEYLMPDDTSSAPSVTDEELLALANAGENWTCSLCGSSERAGCDTCGNCGAKRGGKEYDERDMAVLAQPRTPPKRPIPTPRASNWESDSPIPKKSSQGLKRLAISFVAPLGVAGIIAGIVGLLIWLFTAHETIASVTSLHWQYTEQLQQKEIEHTQTWGVVHSDAFNVHCEKRQHGTKDCKPYDCNFRKEPYECRCKGGETYECNCREKENCKSNKNGSAKCIKTRVCDECTKPKKCDTCYQEKNDTCYEQCPVYEDWCEYDYSVWKLVKKEVTQGNDINPHWFGLNPVGSDQRVIRSEQYSITLKSEDREWHEQWSDSEKNALERFKTYPLNTKVRIEYTYAGTHNIMGPAN